MEIEQKKVSSFLDEYRIIKTLGAGYHAQVKLGIDEHGNYVAIKKYKETATLATLKHELMVMSQLDHQNLVRLISVRENAIYKKKDQTTYNCFAIILEYVGGGQLFDFVAETGKFSEKVTRTYFHQMMNGLNYMHARGFAHRDIKPENLLLSTKFILKIADFGFSCLIKGKKGTGVLTTKLGTQGYMAPQIPNKNYEGKSVDIFAAGVILFIMYAGNPPFEKALPNDPYYKLLKEKKHDVFWKAHSRKRALNYFSLEFQDLFNKMVAFDPTERYTIVEIASHPWVKQIVCTHAEIKGQFDERKTLLDKVLEERREQQEKEKQERLDAINSQGSLSREGEYRKQTKQFLAIYNQQYNIKRQFPVLQVSSNDDIEFRQNNKDNIYYVSLLKNIIYKQVLILNDESNEEEDLNSEVTRIKFSEMKDQKNRFVVEYLYNFDIEGDSYEEKIALEILMGINSQGNFIVQFEREQGNALYYKKIIKDIKIKCR